MYPVITIGNTLIEMTGLAILVSIVTFIVTAFILVKKSRLQFVKLFYRLPTPIILSYVLGSYTSFIIRQGSLIPLSQTQILQLISPYNYQFHVIGILLALSISLYLFLKKMPSRHERRMRINILASSISLAMIPLGIGLLLGDHFIGLPTSGFWGIETFRPDISNRSAYGPTYPVGVMIAATGLITFIIQNIKQNANHPSGQGYMTLSLIIVGIAITRSFVNSPKYFVLQTGFFRRDITTYLCVLLSAILLQQYIIERQRVKNISTS